MFTCCIIDDEAAASTLTGFISLVDHITLTGTYTSPKGLLDRFIVLKPDIIFMDLKLAKKHRIETVHFSSIASLVITGSKPEYAYEALELNAIDYLVKPVEYSGFLRTVIKSKKIRFRELEKSLNNLAEIKDHCFIKNDTAGKKIVKIKFDDIIFVEGSLNYITFIMEECQHLAYLTLKEIEENLPPDKFVRVHKSHIINISKITAVNDNFIFLNDVHKIILGLSYRTNFNKIVNEKLLKSKRSINKSGNISNLTDF